MRLVISAGALEVLAAKRVYFTQDGSSRLQPGQEVFCDDNAYVEPYSAVLQGVEIPTIEAFSYTLSSLPISTRIGRYCSISWGVRVMALNHHMNFVSTSSFSYDPHFVIFKQCLEDDGVQTFSRYGGQQSRAMRTAAPVVEHDVWIGQDVLLARGITLGTGCVIGAGAVVTGSVPPYAIMGGNPAKLIRYRFDAPVRDALLKSAWWAHRVSDFAALRYDDPMIFLDQLAERRRAGLAAYQPERIVLAEILSAPR